MSKLLLVALLSFAVGVSLVSAIASKETRPAYEKYWCFWIYFWISAITLAFVIAGEAP